MTHPGNLLSAYLDDELEAATRAAVGEHLEACRRCHEELASVSAARLALRGLPVLEPPAILVPGHRPRTIPRFARPVWAWAAAVMAALALAAGLVVGPGAAADAVDLGTLADRHTARVVVEPGISTVRAVIGGP